VVVETGRDRRGRRTLGALATLAILAGFTTWNAAKVSAAPGDAVPQLTTKTSQPTEVGGGGTIQYAINYTCSNNQSEEPVDGCDGSLFADPIPLFTNVYGELMPLEFVSATGPASVWPDGFTLDTTDPANPVVRSTAGTWPAGTSGTIFITVQVPAGMVPEGPQTVVNQATVSDVESNTVDPSDEAFTDLVGFTPEWEVSKIGPTTNTRMNRDYDWVVSVCGPSTSALWPVFEITDTLPAGFQFVSAQYGGTFTDDGDTVGISDGAATVTWTFDTDNRPALGADGCFRMTVTGRFPSDYVHPDSEDVNDDNVGGAVKTNVATGLGKVDPADPGTDLGEAPWDTTLVGPQFGSAGTSKRFSDLAGNDNFYTTVGDQGRFNLSASVDSDYLLNEVSLTDGDWAFTTGGPGTSGVGVPPSFLPTAISPGTWNDPVTATIEASVDGLDWDVIESGVVSGAADIAIPGGEGYRSFRWVWTNPGSIRGDFAATGQAIIGELGQPEDDFGLYTNTSTLVVLPDGAAMATDTDSDQYILESPQPHPQVAKTTSNPSRQPGQTTTYTIVARNHADATGNLVNPVVTDCIPEYLDLQGSPTAAAPWVAGPAHTCAAGETPLSFQWNATLAPGAETTAITYTVQVASADPGPVAPYGTYSNTAIISPDGGGSFGHCVNTNPVCGSTAVVTVTPTVELASNKCVSGELDGGIFRPTPRCTDGQPAQTPAFTVPGGPITYRLQLENVGNTDADQIDFVDIFPYVGDTAVITGSGGTLNQRNSEYAPILIDEIEAPAGWTVWYSTSANPCRPEVGGPTTGCDAPNWTSTPDPLALASYRSIKLSHPSQLNRGETAEFTWQMRAPVVDASYDLGGSDPDDPAEFLAVCEPLVVSADPEHCPRAVNSFAYGADAAGLPGGTPQPGRLFAEPPQVEVRVLESQFSNEIGNRVWFDRNYDGLQDPDTSASGEPGIPGIYIELVDSNGDVIATTYTDANGYYLFSSLDGLPIPNGDYTLRFYPPANWYVSPPDVSGDPTDAGAPGGTNPGTNTDDDSDLPRTPSGNHIDLGPYYETVSITLGDNPNLNVGEPNEGESDLTWDLGLWRAEPAVTIDKVTRDSAWNPDDAGDGVHIIQGRPVTWTYTIVNTGNTRLENVSITDNNGTPGNLADDFSVTTCIITEQGENSDGLLTTVTPDINLNRGAEITCTATGTAGTVNYTNIGTVTGDPTTDDGTPVTGTPPGYPNLPAVTDNDPSSYVAGRYDLALAKTVAAPNLATGEVVYTIVVENQGTVPSGDYTVTDLLPEGLSVVSAVPAATSTTPSATTTTITWDLGGLAPGARQTITLTAHIDDYLARPFRNFAEISADSSALVQTAGVSTPTTDADSTPDTDTTNDGDYGPVGEPSAVDNTGPNAIDQAGVGADPEDDADIADFDPQIVYDLALAKVGNSTPVAWGESPTFTVRVYNQGNVSSGPVTVLDQLPTGLVFDAAGSSPTCTSIAGNQARCTITNIAVGDSVVLTIATTIAGTPANYGTAPWQNWAEIETDSAQALYGVDDIDSTPEAEEENGIGADAVPPGDAHTDVTTAGATYAEPTGPDEDDNDTAIVGTSLVYDLALAKVATPGVIGFGQSPTYTVRVYNQGNVPSGPVTVLDQLPTGLVFNPTGSTSGCVATVPAGDNQVRCTIADIPAGEYVDLVIVTTVAGTPPDYDSGPWRNWAEIETDSGQALYGVDDIDSTPEAEQENGIGADGDAPEGEGYVGIPTLDETYTDEDGDEDDNDDAVVTTDLVYDLALAKTAEASAVENGTATITYTLTVENQGNVDSGEYTVVDTLPAGLELVSATPAASATTSNTVTWTGTNLEPGEQATYTLVVTVTDFTQRPFRNYAEIASDSAQALYGVDDIDSTPDDDPYNDFDGASPDDDGYGPIGDDNPADNADIDDAGEGADEEDDADIADVDFELAGLYDLALAKTVAATPTGDLVYTVTVQNQGELDSREVVVTDYLPVGVVVVDLGTAVDNGDGTLAWTLDNLPAGDTITLTFTARITDYLARPYRNIAEISSDSADDYSSGDDEVADVDSTPDNDPDNDGDYGPVGDPSGVDNTGPDAIDQAGEGDDPEDDADVADYVPTIVYDLALVKVGPATITVDGNATFTITVANQGNVASGPFTVTDVIPPGMVAVSASAGGVIAAGGVEVVWTDLASLAPGATVNLTVTTRVTDVTLRPYTNFAEITADGADGYSLPGDPISDRDSLPGDPETSNVDNTTIGQAGVGGDIGFDDEDIAVVDLDIVYDLALDKRLPSGQSYRLGDVVRFEIEVTNEGNVASGPYSVSDTLPTGLTFVAASNGGTAAGQGIAWTNLPSLAPGASLVLTVDARFTDVSQSSYVNLAEITDDDADSYSTPTDPVTDVDSTPGIRLGEDDEGQAEIPVEEINAANPVPTTTVTFPTTTVALPSTTVARPVPNIPNAGARVATMLSYAAVVLAVGLAFYQVRRKRPA